MNYVNPATIRPTSITAGGVSHRKAYTIRSGWDRRGGDRLTEREGEGERSENTTWIAYRLLKKWDLRYSHWRL